MSKSRSYAFVAEAREQTGKGVARSLRRDNRIPAVIYGAGEPPVTISLSARDANLEYNRGHMFTSVCDMALQGKTHKVLARDVQVHPVTGFVEHVDFLRVTGKTTVTVKVHVRFVNEESCPGLEAKGTLNIVRHDVDLISLAMNIPDVLEVNLEGKVCGDAIKISDAIMPDGAKPAISDRDFTIATLIAPKRLSASDEDESSEAENAESAEA